MTTTQAESRQLDEIQAGIKELDRGQGASHKKVADWLRSWGVTVSEMRLACDHRFVASGS